MDEEKEGERTRLRQDDAEPGNLVGRDDEESPQKGSKSTYTYEEAIAQVGFGRYQWLMLLICGAAVGTEGLEIMLMVVLLPEIAKEWGHTTEDEWRTATVGSVVFAGMFIGGYVWGLCADLYGRRRTFLAVLVCTGGFGLLTTLTPSDATWGFAFLIISRWVVGIGVGGGHVEYSLFMEFLPTSSRGPFMVAIEAFWSVASVMLAAMAWVVIPTLGWRWLVFFAALPILVLAAVYPWVPESPRFLLITGKVEEAQKTLALVAKVNRKPLPVGDLVNDQVEERRGRVTDLFSPQLARTTLLLWFLWISNVLVYYGIVLLTPQYFENLVEDDENSMYMVLVITTMAELPGLVLVAFLINWVGRKKSQAIAFFGSGVFVALLLYDSSVALSTIFAFGARALIYGAFAATFAYTPEVYPTSVRGVGLGAAYSVARVAGIPTPYVVRVLAAVSVWIPIFIFIGFCACATAASLLLPLETFNRGLQDTLQQQPLPIPETLTLEETDSKREVS